MKLIFAHICDYAAVMQGGKLLMVGEFENIHAAGAPVGAGFWLVGRFEAFVNEGTEHTLRISLVTADGAEVGRTPDIPLKFVILGPGRPLRANFMAPMAIEFPAFGTYEFHLIVDGRSEAQLPIHIVQRNPPHGPAR